VTVEIRAAGAIDWTPMPPDFCRQGAGRRATFAGGAERERAQRSV